MYCISSAILLTKIKLRTDYVCQFGFLTKYSQTGIPAKENIFDEKQKKKKNAKNVRNLRPRFFESNAKTHLRQWFV